MRIKRKLKSFMNVTVTPIALEVVKKDGKTRTIHSFQLSAEIDKAKEVKIRRMDGMTCFITNDKILSPARKSARKRMHHSLLAHKHNGDDPEESRLLVIAGRSIEPVVQLPLKSSRHQEFFTPVYYHDRINRATAKMD